MLVSMRPVAGPRPRSNRIALVALAALTLIGLARAASILQDGWRLLHGESLERRKVEVRVDRTLTADGGWPSGKTSLSQPPEREYWVEVTPKGRPNDQLTVLVRHVRLPYHYDTELTLSIASDRTPSVSVRGGSSERGSGWNRPYRNIGGEVRVSSYDFSPTRLAREPSLVIEYDLVADGSGSPVHVPGKVVLNADDLR
jgi:hypothetical protein